MDKLKAQLAKLALQTADAGASESTRDRPISQAASSAVGWYDYGYGYGCGHGGLSSEYPFSVRWGSRYTSVSGVYAASASSNAAKDLVSEDR